MQLRLGSNSWHPTKKLAVIVIGAAGITLLVIASIVGITKLRGGVLSSTMPSLLQVAGRVDFPLYYPTDLPRDFSFRPESLRSGDNVILYQVASQDKTVNVSFQPMPNDFDFAYFYKHNLSGTQTFSCLAGRATFGLPIKGTMTSIEGKETWTIISTTGDIDFDTIREIAEGLRKLPSA